MTGGQPNQGGTWGRAGAVQRGQADCKGGRELSLQRSFGKM